MKKIYLFPLLLCTCILFLYSSSYSQTSWKGVTSTLWKTASNWTNGVPTAITDVTIGDANFTGLFQPTISTSSTCRALQVGGGTKASTLTVSKNLTITGNLTVSSNGTITQNKSTITIQGNWLNSGTYTGNNTNAIVSFGGVAQSLGGSTATIFRKLKINAGSTVTLGTNISASGSSNYIYVYGTLNPGQSPTYTVTAASTFRVYSGAVLKVNAATFTANYAPTLTLYTGSIIDYSSTTVNQTIYSITYSTLKISGTTTKSLAANLPSLSSSTSAEGNIYVLSGTLDLLSYTANRGTSVTGGNFSVSNGATLKIGSTNTFPVNFNNVTLSLTSVTEYNGTTQTVASKTYGNLRLTSSSGVATKSTSASAFTVAGNLVTETGAGTGVIFNAGAAITISGHDSIGTATTFNGGSYAHTVAGNWINNGTFTGSTSTINMAGAGSTISGSGTQNFYNLSLNASNITATSSDLSVTGNLATSGSGTFTHGAGNTITMSGTGKTISGLSIVLNNLIITGTVTTASSFSITGNMSISGSLASSAGNITMNGASKTITGAGTIGFYGLLLSGTVTTTSNFSVSNSLDVSGSFTASTGTATFTGSATLNGTVNLYNATLNATSLLLSTNSVLGIANTFTISAGTLNVTTAIPNTVTFNGSGAQNIPSATFYRLVLANGGTKTASGAITTNGIFTIDPSVTFNAATFNHIIQSNLVNNGTFTAGSSTITFSGTKDVTISGATTFNILTINKSSSANVVTLLNNVSTPTVNMTTGVLKTGSNTITITSTRTGNGIILGNIQRTHSFTTGTAYTFESPDNSITFSSVTGVSTITVAVSQTSIADFPYGASANRLYNISVPSGTYNATLRMHYEDAELNGNVESTMLLWNYNGTIWSNIGKTGNSTTSNYVEYSGLTNITNRWTFSGVPSVLRWNGSSSTSWNTPANWTIIQGTPGSVPGTNDIVQIGQGTITNQPTINSAVSVKNIEFGSVAAATLTITSGGSLSTYGNISGTWTGNATHTINAGAQNITLGGSLILSDGTTGHAINLNASSGTITIGESLVESGGANISLSGAVALYIGKSFTYIDGTFSAGSSTVYYNGSIAQAVGGVIYHHLTISKSAGIAIISNALTVNGSMSVTGGELNVNANATLAGSLNVSAASTINISAATLSIGGDLNNSGTFIPGNGTISFVGTSAQMISLATFNNIIINNPSGAVTFTGSIDVYGDFSILAGNIDLGSYTANRTSPGGIFTLAAGTGFLVSGANDFPANYSSYLLDSTSTVTYNGTGVQSISSLTYGNLVASNGGSNAKTLAGHITVKGNYTINSGATVNAGNYNLSLNGNWLNNGTFVPSTGAVLLNGINKTVTGVTTFNKLTVYGIYTVAGSNIIYNGLVNITTGASYDGGSGSGIVNGDLINSGTLISTGTTTFSGTTVQTIRLLSPIQSNANGVINFNGTVAPVLNSTAVPQFATLNINNTGGINPSVNWVVGIAFNIASGATFNGGVSTHTIYGSFTNNGTVTSSGTMNFYATQPSLNYTLKGTGFSSTGTVIFGGPYPVTVSGIPTALNDVVIANTSGVTPAANWNITGNFTVNSNAVFNAGSYSYTVAGDIESNGTLNGGTSTFTMSGAAAEISGSPGTTFYNFVVTGNVTANVDFNVSNNFTNNNVFDASIGNLVMTGSGASIIGGTASPFILAQVEILKSGSGTVTLAKNLVDVLNIDIFSGTLDASTYSVTQDAAGGALFIRDNATLKIGGTNTIPAFSSYSIDTLSTVEYYGSTQTITSLSAAGGNYGNLIISSAGTKTANGSLNIYHDFTLSTGTFFSGSYTDTLIGNWSMASGSLTSTGTTLTLYGLNNQTINSTGAFNNLIVNKSAGSVTLGTNISLGGALTFTLGKITTGSNTLIMTSSSATVNGAGQLTGWVYGKLQKTTQIGMTSRSFDIGDATAYTPTTVAFAWVMFSGNLTAVVSSSDHADLTNSGINGGKSVNRYFTFTNNSTTFTSASITMNWVAGDVDAGATTGSFKVKRYDGSAWTLLTVASPLATSIQASGVTAFNDFAIGEIVAASNWTGSTNTSWNTAGNWSAGVPTASTNITVPGSLSNYPLINSGTVSVLNVTMNSGATLTVSGATLEIGGTITNSGTVIASSGSVTLNGNNAQTIPAALFQNNVVKSLTINNAAGVTLAGTLGLTDVLTLTSGQFATAGYLTLKSSATGTSRVAEVTGGTVTGNVTIERYNTNRRAWRLLTVPVAHSNSIYNGWQNGGVYQAGKGTFITGTAPNPAVNGLDYSTYNNISIKTFITATQAYQNITNTRSTNLSGNTKDSSDNIGYLVFSRGDRNPANLNTSSSTATTLSGSGKLQTGPQLFPASSVANKYTMIGNPYASPINFDLLTKTNLVNRFFVWDPTLNQVGGYVTVDDIATPGTYVASPSSAQTKDIQSGQAFFVVTLANGTASLGINENDKSSVNNTAVFRPMPATGTSAVASFRTDLYLLDNNNAVTLADGALAQFRDGFNAGVDYQDADKFGNANETIGLLRNGTLLSIERRPVILNSDTLFFKLTKTTQRNYQFAFIPESIDAPGLAAFLEDTYTNVARALSLTDTSTIDFSINANVASQASNRFRVVFKSVSVLPVTYTSVTAQQQNNAIAVEWKVASQLNIKNYEVEKSGDGRNFTKVSTTAASANASVYNWLDVSPVTGSNFYRIRNVDMDGSFQYSKIVEVKIDKTKSGFSVYPNPVTNNTIGLQMNNQPKGDYTLRLVNMAGQVLFTKSIYHPGGNTMEKIYTNTQLSKGVYKLELTDAKNTMGVVNVNID